MQFSGADVLTNPEPGFFILGSKSYGRWKLMSELEQCSLATSALHLIRAHQKQPLFIVNRTSASCRCCCSDVLSVITNRHGKRRAKVGEKSSAAVMAT